MRTFRSLCPFSLLKLLLLLTAAAHAQVNFESTAYPFANPALSVAEGDFNRDGVPDVAIGNGHTVSVLLATAPGRFSAPADYDVGSEASQVIAGYFTRNSEILDLVVVHKNEAQLSILANNGDGTFQSAAVTPLSHPALAAIAGDLNNDGVTDICVIETTGLDSLLETVVSNGDGTFRRVTTANAFHELRGLATGDIDQDGNLDIFTTNINPDQVDVYFGNGDGTFRGVLPAQIAITDPMPGSSGDGTWNVTGLDANNDGIIDLVGLAGNACTGTTCTRADAHVFLTTFLTYTRFNFAGSFTAWPLSSAGTLLPADFNGDQRQDLLYWSGSPSAGGTAFFAGGGDGSFSPMAANLSIPNISGVVSRDLDLDSRRDLAISSTSQGAVVALNQSASTNCLPPSSATLAVRVCGLNDGDTVPPVFTLQAAGNSPAGVGELEVWVDGAKVSQTLSDQLRRSVSVSPGPHQLRVIAVDRLRGFPSGTPNAFVEVNITAAAPPPPQGTGCAAGATRTVHICAPVSGSTVVSPVHLTASVHAGSAALRVVQVYVDGAKKFETGSSGLGQADDGGMVLNTDLAMSAGSHRVTVQAVDASGTFKSTVNITVGSGGGGGGGGGGGATCDAPTTPRVMRICTPASGATVNSPVHITTAAYYSSNIRLMQVYVDGVKKAEGAPTLNDSGGEVYSTNVSMSAGTHRLTVQALDSSGSFKATESITVR